MIPVRFTPAPLCPDSALELASEARAYRVKARQARRHAIPRDPARAMVCEKIARSHEARIRAYADALIRDRQTLAMFVREEAHKPAYKAQGV